MWIKPGSEMKGLSMTDSHAVSEFSGLDEPNSVMAIRFDERQAGPLADILADRLTERLPAPACRAFSPVICDKWRQVAY